MTVRHYDLQYNVNGGPWLAGKSDETPGPGKTLIVSGLSTGTYAVKLRMVPLSGDTTPIVSGEAILQVGTPGISEPVQTIATSDVTVSELIARRDTLLAAAGVTVTAADAQVMNEALLSSATANDSVVTGFVDTAISAADVTATITSVQTMLEQVVATINAAATVLDGKIMTDAASTAADIVASATDTYQQATNTSPTFSQQPTQTAATATSATVSYTVADTDGDHYALDYSTGSGFLAAVANEAPGAHTFTVPGLSAGTTYNVQLRATPLAGVTTAVLSSWAAITTVPVAPTLSVSAGNAQNTLIWGAVTDATGYAFYWTDDGTDPTKSSNRVIASSGYVHTGRTNGVTYKYAVVAYDSAGESVLSNIVSATPSAASYPLALSDGASITTTPVAMTALVANSGSLSQTAADTFQITNSTASKNAAVKFAAASTYTSEIEITARGTADGSNFMVFGNLDASPASTWSSTNFAASRKITAAIYNVSGNTGIAVYYTNTAGTVYYLQSNGTWSTTSYTFPAVSFTGNQRLKIQKDATNYIVTLMNGAGTVVATGTIAIASVRNGSGSDHVAIGDFMTDYTSTFTFKVRQ